MKLNKASFQYMFALLFSVATLFAQNITGTVNGDDGSALAGANVAVEGTDSGASSNQDGSFSISGLSDGTYTVTASYIGYEDASAVVTISGGQASSVNLTLDRGDIRLNQVVVSASLKKELVTEAPASVTVFGGEELEARSATTLTDVIGNQAGVEYMKTGLESSNLSLRGFNGVFSGAIHAVVDNRWTRAPVVNAQLLQFFAPDDSDVERVELVRGPASPMYGPDTQQGVISLFTKSPFNQGNRIALTVGDRNFMKIYGRVAHQWGARAATRISFSHRSFDDWESNMPRSLAEAQAEGHSYFEPELIRRGLQTTTYPFIDYGPSSGYNDPVQGSPNTATSAEPFSPEATVFETKTEIRPDLKSNLTINTRMANLSAIEMTGVGRQFADDVDLYQFQLAYFRQDVLGGDLYLNFFTNINDQKTTYSLVNGNVVYDESSNRAFQLQHTVPMKNGQTVIWGLDYLDRTPETKGTINGKNEDDDNFDNLGVYYSYEKKFSDKFKFVGTGRLDQNNYLDAIGTSSVFAPKLAFVWSPEDVRGNFRLTYGENIDLPGNFPKNLDIAVYRDFVYKQNLGIDFQSAAFGSLPFNPDIQVKAMGSTTTGWTYDRDANGVPTYRSNWSPALGLGVNTNYAMGNNTMNAAAFGVWAPIMMGSILQSEAGAGYNAAYAAGVAAAFAAATGADAATAAAYGAQQAGLAAQAVMALAGSVSPDAYSNVVIDETFSVVDPVNQYPDFPATKETTWAQTEFGYKGQVTDNMTLSVDVYDLVISDYITNLQNISGMVTVLGDGGSYVGNVLTYLATAGDANLVNWINGWDAAAAGGNGNGTGADEFAGLLLGTVAQAPIGMVAPEQSPYGGNLIYGYKQLTEDLNLQGLEVAMSYFPTAEWTFNMNLSLLSDSSLTVDFKGVEQFVNMNTPKFKLGGGMQYASDDVSYGMNLRYQDSYFADGFSGTSGEVDGFYTLGVNAKWNLEAVDGMSVGLSIDNITDVVHRETFLGPEMGRFTSISLGYDL